MKKTTTIALDAMGGDKGPEMVVPGADLAIERHPDLHILLFGDKARIEPLLAGLPRARRNCRVVHTDNWVKMDDKPSQALRSGRRNSSMWLTIEAVKNGEAGVAVSAGNTGALMAMSKIVLNTMPGISRPAIAGVWPTLRGESIVLDIGATIGADAQQLVDFAVMGEAMARCLFGIKRPTVGLLNVGVEEVKGIEEVKEAGRILRNAGLPIEYCGFVEGDDIGKGTVDVVVTEGFTGNIALKTAEGTAKQIAELLKRAMTRSLSSKLGYILAKAAFDELKAKMDPRNANGGVFLGLNGIVVKSHGGTDAVGLANAIDNALEMADNRLFDKIAADIQSIRDAVAEREALQREASTG